MEGRFAADLGDQVGGREDEYLAHQIGFLLVAAHEADHLATGGVLHHLLESLPHQILELHPLFDHSRAAAAVEQTLLDSTEAPSKQADHQIVLVVGLDAGRSTSVSGSRTRRPGIRCP